MDPSTRTQLLSNDPWAEDHDSRGRRLVADRWYVILTDGAGHVRSLVEAARIKCPVIAIVRGSAYPTGGRWSVGPRERGDVAHYWDAIPTGDVADIRRRHTYATIMAAALNTTVHLRACADGLVETCAVVAGCTEPAFDHGWSCEHHLDMANDAAVEAGR